MSRPFVRLALIALTIATPLVAQSPSSSTGRRGIAAITEADLKRDLYTMAGDHFRGREAGTLDELKASTWLVEQLRALGMTPAGDDGTYLQWWPMRHVRLASNSIMTVGTTTLTRLQDAFVLYPTDASIHAPLVYAGTGDAAALRGADVKGKIAVATIVAPPNAPGTEVSLREWRYARLAIARQSRALREAGAAAAILVADSVTEVAWHFLSNHADRGSYAVDSAGVEQRPQPSMPVLVVRAGLKGALEAATQGVLDLHTESFVFPSVNVVGRLPGTNRKSGEVVLFSSHQDHDGVRQPIEGDSIWNGADDNGSVSVALLAIARAWKREPGKRGALFVWQGAEERGLLGSSWYSAHPTVPKDSIVAVLNADMIGRGPADSAALLGRFPPHRNSAALVELALEANRRTARFALDTLWDQPSHPEGWYFRSDHLPYARAGYPAIEYSTLLHPDYHTPRDEPSRIDYPKLAKMTAWMYETGLLVANAAQRVMVDPGFTLER